MRACFDSARTARCVLLIVLLSACTTGLPPVDAPVLGVADNSPDLEVDGEWSEAVADVVSIDASAIDDAGFEVQVDASPVDGAETEVVLDMSAAVDAKKPGTCALPGSASPTDKDVACQLAFAITSVFPMGKGVPIVVTIADFDGDASNDVAVLSYGNSPPGQSLLRIYHADGSLMYDGEVGSWAEFMAAGDVDGNCAAELLFTTSYQTPKINSVVSMFFLFAGAGPKTVLQPLADWSGALVAANFDGTGSLDLAVAHTDGVQILFGTGDGHFSPYAFLATSMLSSLMLATDLDADGKVDLVSQFSPQTIFASRNAGDGMFQPSNWLYLQPGSIMAAMPSLGSADVDGDGLPEIIVTGTGYFAVVHWSPGKIEIVKKFTWGSTDFRNFDCAGEPSSAVAHGPGAPRLAIFQDDCHPLKLFNLGQANLVPSTTIDIGSGPYVHVVVAAGYLDADGWEDWAVAKPGQLWLIKSNCGK